MLRAPLVLALAFASLASTPTADGDAWAPPQRLDADGGWPTPRDGWQGMEQGSIRKQRGSSLESIIFPSKELEDYLNSMRVRPGDAIVFPGNSAIKPVFNTDFGYGAEDGPHTWPRTFPSCGGRHQSPIDISRPHLARPGAEGVTTTPLSFAFYDSQPSRLTLSNSGHSLRMTGNWTTESVPRVSGFVLAGEYAVSEVHFHWGSNDGEGSEHLVQGHRYPLEMHVVHYKMSYGSFSDASTKKDGLVVISYLFEIQKQINPGLQKLLAAIHEVIYPKTTGVPLSNPFPLDKLAPPFTRKYASYLGSLTTPPCSEIVRWIVNLEPQVVSAEQIEKLRGLKRGDGAKMLFNFRPIQSLNGREIIMVT